MKNIVINSEVMNEDEKVCCNCKETCDKVGYYYHEDKDDVYCSVKCLKDWHGLNDDVTGEKYEKYSATEKIEWHWIDPNLNISKTDGGEDENYPNDILYYFEIRDNEDQTIDAQGEFNPRYYKTVEEMIADMRACASEEFRYLFNDVEYIDFEHLNHETW